MAGKVPGLSVCDVRTAAVGMSVIEGLRRIVPFALKLWSRGVFKARQSKTLHELSLNLKRTYIPCHWVCSSWIGN